MADISSFLKKILSAIYGEEVRGSIHDALAAMNTESSSAMEFASTAKVRTGNAALLRSPPKDAEKKATSASESAAAAALSEGSTRPLRKMSTSRPQTQKKLLPVLRRLSQRRRTRKRSQAEGTGGHGRQDSGDACRGRGQGRRGARENHSLRG